MAAPRVRRRAWLLLAAAAACAARAAAQDDAALQARAGRVLEASVRAYEAGEEGLPAVTGWCIELHSIESGAGRPAPETRATFFARLDALERLAARRAGPARDVDLQRLACVRAVSAEEATPAAQAAAVAAIGTLLELQRARLQAGEGDPDDHFLWSRQLGLLEDSPEGHERRQRWLAQALRAQGRGAGADYYELAASPEEEPRIQRGAGIGEFVVVPGPREEALRAAARAGWERALAAAGQGACEPRVALGWSLRVEEGDPRSRMSDRWAALAQEHVERMRALEAAARAAGASPRTREACALLVALAERRAAAR